MDVLTLLGLCVVFGISNGQNTTAYHIFMDDGDEIKPEINILDRKYTKNQYRKWTLQAPGGVWGLAFQQFSLEYSISCEYDYLQIQELNNRTMNVAPLRPVRYCGERLPPPYVSVSPGVEVVFVSDAIWENEGFIIQVLHADTREKLLAKMEPYVETSERRQVSEKPPDTSSQHPIFYTLIGCSIALLIVFALLLTYFIRSIRKKASKPSIKVPDSLYIQPLEMESQPRKPSVVIAVDPASFGCKIGKSGKRYSKDNKHETGRKTLVQEPRAQYNNVYVTENMSSNG